MDRSLSPTQSLRTTTKSTSINLLLPIRVRGFSRLRSPRALRLRHMLRQLTKSLRQELGAKRVTKSNSKLFLICKTHLTTCKIHKTKEDTSTSQVIRNKWVLQLIIKQQVMAKVDMLPVKIRKEATSNITIRIEALDTTIAIIIRASEVGEEVCRTEAGEVAT